MGFWSKIFKAKLQNVEFNEQKKSDLGIRLNYDEKCNKCGGNFLVAYELCEKNSGGGEKQLKCLNCGEVIVIIIPQGRIFKDTLWPL